MNKVVSSVISLLVIVFCVIAIIFIPKWFPEQQREETLSTSSFVSSNQGIVNTAALVSKCDTVFYGNVIKEDVKEDYCIYSVQVTSVLYGRNLTSMGYVKVEGQKTLQLTHTYLFFALTEGTNKYHYVKPFLDAPWIFEILDGGTLNHVSKGDISNLSDKNEFTLSYVKDICNQTQSSK